MTVNPNAGKLRRHRMSWEADFTLIPNAWARDKRLSFTARGILTWLQSHDPEFEVTLESIAAASTHGLLAIRTAVRELEALGYLKRYRERLAKGRLGGTIWEQRDPFETEHPQRSQLDMTHLLPITDRQEKPRSEPTCDYPTLDSPTLDNPTLENSTTIEEHLEEDLTTNNLQPLVTSRESENVDLLDSERRIIEQRAATPRPADYLAPWTPTEAQLVAVARELPCAQGRVHRIPENVRCCVVCTASFAVLERQAMDDIHADRYARRNTPTQEASA